MSINKKRQLIGLLIIVGLLLVILAISLPGIQMQLGQDLRARQEVDKIQFGTASEDDYTLFNRFVQIFSNIVIFLLIVYFFVSLFSREGRKRLLGMVIVFLVLLLMIVIFSNILGPMEEMEQEPESPVEEEEWKEPDEGLGTPVEFDPEPKSWLLVVMIVSGAALLAFVVFSFVNKIPEQSVSDAVQFEELAQTAQSALADINADISSFDDTIVRCYVEMSYVLQTQTGIHRKKAMTTFEFEQELIQFGFPAEPVQQLTRLFEQVRYGHQQSGEEEKQVAVESLSKIVEYCKVFT